MKFIAAITPFFLSILVSLCFNVNTQASSAMAVFTPPEVATGTVSCKAEWNQFCEDQKTIKVPEGHKLCKHTVTAKEKTGDSAYEIVSTDSQGITVKFSAKGNRDRLKQQGASIVLNILLLGVRENIDCMTGVVATPIASSTPAPKVAVITENKPAAAVEQKVEAKPAPITTQEAKPHACACSQWIDADKVFNCLVNGYGRDHAKCDSYATTIQCVTSKEECRESQKENCPQIAGLNQATSNKRLFVLNSPYCQRP